MTIPLVTKIAVKIDVTIPILKVIANPFIGPVPIAYRIRATNKVVIFASIIVPNAFEKPFFIAN